MDAAGSTAAPVVDAVGSAAAPVTDALGSTAAPVVDAAGSTAAPVVDAVGSAAAPVTDVLGSTAAPVVDAAGLTAAPVVDAVGSAAAPLTDALVPVVAPLQGAVGTAAGPLTDALAAAPVTESLGSAAAPAAEAAASLPGTAAAAAAPLAHFGGAGSVPRPDALASVTTPLAPAPHTLVHALPTTGPVAETVVPTVASPSHLPVHSIRPHSELASLPIDNAFAFDPSIIAEGLATWEAKMIIGGLLSGFIAGRAAGIGMIDFTQPMLHACTVSVRAAFSQVRLLPCDQTWRAMRSGFGSTPDGGERARGGTKKSSSGGGTKKSSSGNSSPVARPDDVTSTLRPAPRNPFEAIRPFSAVKPFLWSVPAAGGMLLRLVACMLASLSAMIAARAGIRRHGRDRNELPYRRRLEP